ncbi:hypothetical protein MMC34_000929 [Xylographa carneopallida]|nr:hypothetical protein [Xylographa carneopallida]
MSGLQQVQGAFETARKDFLNNLTNKNHYNFSNIRNINDVYNETQRIQEIQGSQGTLRNLNRIRPFLRRIEEYASVIEIFILVKPEVLALLWISSTCPKSFDKLLDLTTHLADALPRLKVYEELFRMHARITHVLCLFYTDILDFYAVNLEIYNAKGWKMLFESLWPRYDDKIAIVHANITRHMELLQSEVTVADISAALQRVFSP